MAEAAQRTRVEVRVELKPGIFDAEADSVFRSLERLGVAGVRGVSTARLYTLEFEAADPAEATRTAQKAVDRLLANPVIHRVTVAAARG
ncbi:MAG TPA: phosphoribosylformylglycinamidine synthase subunit PurS [Thermoplasmata archaeon]|nr:phosphoribosylformylglycinamidine synthase subunit PurS [Thermoplasmata archaeon]